MNERDIFLAAIDIADPADRAAYLDQVCAANADLRAQVEELLKNHEQASQFIETPAVAIDSALAQTILGDSPDTDHDLEGEWSEGRAEFCRYLQPSTRPDWLGRLGHYEIEEIIGRGAFGIVAKAFDEKLHRVVAIKLMSPQLASTSPPRKRFLREARTAAAVTHENIVAIHAVEEQPIPYLVMEYIPGCTLQQRMDECGPLDVAEVLRIGQQVAAGMAAAHQIDLIHRDIKPSNILLSDAPQSRVKISDFGLARAVDDASLTQSGLISGTPMYMAPEQARGETVDHRADLFSLGTVLYQMIAGRPPFRAANTVAVLKRVCEDTPRPLSDVLPGTPDWLERIVFKLLEKERGNRFQTAQELADLLARCQWELEHNGKVTCLDANSGSSAPRARQAKTPVASATKKNHFGWLAGGVVAVAAVIAFVLMNGNSQTHDSVATPLKQAIAEQEEDQLDRGQPIDLISLLVPSRDFLDSRLKVEDGKLITPRFEYPGAVGMIAHDPLPNDYDIELQLERKSNAPGAGFNFGIVVDGRQVTVGMDCGSGTRGKAWGLDWLDGNAGHLKANATHNPGSRFIIGKTSNVNIRVRDNHITAICDGEKLIDWTGDPQRLGLWGEVERRLSKPDSLFFFSQADFIVHQMKLIPRGVSISDQATTWHGWPAGAPAPAIAPFGAEQAKQHQQAWADYLGVPVEYENSIGIKFRLVPPGEFLMGSTPEEIEATLELAQEDQAWQEKIRSEGPLHKVILTQPVYVAVTETTQAQYEQVMGTNLSRHAATGERNEAVANLETGNHPVEMVSWNDAAEFCAKLSQQNGLKPFYARSENVVTALEGAGYRLPTEAEWECACRAGTTTRFWCGDGDQDLPQAGWFVNNSDDRTHAVGGLKTNPFGLSDMHGNVWEWVQDSWDPVFYEKFQKNAAVDPSHPFSISSQRVIRGGSWSSKPAACRSLSRYAYHSTLRHHGGLGFRVLLEVDAVQQLLGKKPATPSTNQSSTSRG